MRVVTHLTVIALVAALGTVTLATSAWSAGGALAAVPAAWWSTTQIAQSAVVLACGLGAAGLPVAPGLSGDRAGRSVRGPLGHG